MSKINCSHEKMAKSVISLSKPRNLQSHCRVKVLWLKKPQIERALSFSNQVGVCWRITVIIKRTIVNSRLTIVYLKKHYYVLLRRLQECREIVIAVHFCSLFWLQSQRSHWFCSNVTSDEQIYYLIKTILYDFLPLFFSLFNIYQKMRVMKLITKIGDRV